MGAFPFVMAVCVGEQTVSDRGEEKFRSVVFVPRNGNRNHVWGLDSTGLRLTAGTSRLEKNGKQFFSIGLISSLAFEFLYLPVSPSWALSVKPNQNAHRGSTSYLLQTFMLQRIFGCF